MSPARSASARSKPFTFDRSFDDPSKVYLPGEKYGPAVEIKIPKKVPTKDTANKAKETEPEAPPPPPKIYTEADLEAAKEDGYVEGHTAALEEAETAREHYAADALNLISEGLGALTAHQDKANAEIGQTAMRMVYAIIEKVVPEHAQASAIESVEALVREVLPLVYEEPKLTVRTHTMIAEDVQNQLNTICEKSNFNGEISVVPDYELQPGDCRVEWNGGGADRNEDRLWKEIRTIVEENVGAVDVQAMDAAADAIPDDDISADGATEDAILTDSAEPNAADNASEESSSTAIQDAALSEQAETVVSDQDEAQQGGLEQDGSEQNKEPESLATDETTSENDTITENKPEPSGSN